MEPFNHPMHPTDTGDPENQMPSATIRDMYATAALTGIISRNLPSTCQEFESVVKKAFAIADVALENRRK